MAKRGTWAGRQVVAEANERADREERLARELEARKEREDADKVARKQATHAQMMRDVRLSHVAQARLKAQHKVDGQLELKHFVQEVGVGV